MKTSIMTITAATMMMMFGTTVAEAKDVASGMPTGKRQLSVKTIKAGPLAGISAKQLSKASVSPRDIATGQASGKRLVLGDYSNGMRVKVKVPTIGLDTAKGSIKRSRSNLSNN